MNKQIAWYVGFFIAAAAVGVALKFGTNLPNLARTLITMAAGVGGGWLAEILTRKPKNPYGSDDQA